MTDGVIAFVTLHPLIGLLQSDVSFLQVQLVVRCCVSFADWESLNIDLKEDLL